MKPSEIRETLEKQMQLLSERFNEPLLTDSDLISISNAIIGVAHEIATVFDLALPPIE